MSVPELQAEEIQSPQHEHNTSGRRVELILRGSETSQSDDNAFDYCNNQTCDECTDVVVQQSKQIAEAESDL